MGRLDEQSLLERAHGANEADGDPSFVAAVARGFAVIEAFDAEHALLSLQDLAERSRLPKATASRIAYTLVKLGYLALDPASQHYRLGPKVATLARHFVGGRGVARWLKPVMHELADRIGAAVALTEREGLEMVYIDYCRAGDVVVVSRGIGTRAPLAKSAAGRTYLAATGTAEREYLIELLAQDGMSRPDIAASAASASEDLSRFGFCRSFGGWVRHVNAVAAPLRSPVDGTLLVVSVAAPSFIIPDARFQDEIGPALVAKLSRQGD